MIILPVWLWLILFVIVFAVAGVMWMKKNIVDRPKSARAVASGTAIASPKLEASCRSSILNRERTAPGRTQFIGFVQPLEFTGAGQRARTPISLGLTERTLGVCFNQGSLGNIVTVLINRRDVTAAYAGSAPYASPAPGELSYSLATAKVPRLTFRLQSQDDLNLLASWATAGQRPAGDLAP